MFPAFQQTCFYFLRQSWHELNEKYCACALSLPTFVLLPGRNPLGRWDLATRELGIATWLLLHHSAAEVLEVLKHEMAHQFADEVLTKHRHRDETPHGSAFQYACLRFEIQHHARFRPATEAHPLIRRVQKLLALASSHNIHEAEAAMARAQQLMAKYQLEVGLEEDPFRYLFLGKPVGRKSLVHQLRISILVRFFQVTAVWIPTEMVATEKPVWVVELCGTPANLDIAAYVFAYLGHEVDWLWRDHRGQRPWLKGIKPKREFQVGVLRGLIAKLAAAGQPASGEGRELIALKTERLKAFFQQRHPDTTRGRASSYHLSDAFKAGFEQGKQLDIRKGIKDKKPLHLTSG